MDRKAARGVASLCNHVGIVVKDLEKTIEFYSSTLGVGPFQIREFKTEGATFHGKPASAKFKTAVAPIGQFEMELIQVLEGETPHTEFLRSKGEGLNHLCLEVRDFENKMAELGKKGIQPLYYYRGSEAGFVYLNTDKIGGITFELIEPL
jgi:methylmalonyl-CoA/ethylmalonyl-CoA epimerase